MAESKDTTGASALPSLPSLPFRAVSIAGRKRTHVIFAPAAAERRAIAAALDLLELPEFRFEGEITPQGRRDLMLEGSFTARVVQPCSVTLAPVTTRLTGPVRRLYLADFVEPTGDEVEMLQDDAAEPLPEVIDAAAVAIEELALALPLYPRAKGAELGEAVFAPPGAEPLRDADLKPFAALASLVRKEPSEDGGDPT